MWWPFKRKRYTIEDFNLQEECKLRFDKDDYSRYVVSFYHPVYKRWWTLPEGRHAAIHERWSLLNHGSFGAYNINKMTCSFNEIDYIKNRYKTIGDIKNYLDRMAEIYEEFQEHKRKQNELPNTIM